jgi:hypothetical protein
MFTLRLWQIGTQFEFRIYDQYGIPLFRSFVTYKGKNSAKRWARYWADKLSSEPIQFEDKI